MKTYSFKIQFNTYKHTNAFLQDVKSIYVSGICIVAKNAKEGCFYFSPYAKICRGKFHYVAGSIRYPVLIPKSPVTIQVTNFPNYPKLQLDMIEHKPFISITDIKEYEE